KDGDIWKKKKGKGIGWLLSPRAFFLPPAVGAALERKKALWGFTTRTGQGGVVFSPAYEPE
ncbi:hypothetical protein WQ67_25890, partial [Escherichia coli]|uniref:hypothetical protein n=1 Tax=Escherichia coli TaxID=562 RepID=UPI0006A4E1CE